MLRALVAASAVSLGALGCTSTSSNTGDGADPCMLDDADGVLGGAVTFQVTVDDHAFTPAVLKAENLAHVTLTVKNAGTKLHDLVFECLATPNDNGCATMSCFPDQAKVSTIAPGAMVTVMFETPNPEGIYDFRSDVPGDTQSGQLVVQ